MEVSIQTFIGKDTLHTNDFQSSMYKFVFKNCLNLSKRNLKFELKQNFDLFEIDITNSKKYRVTLDYSKNRVQIDTALSCLEFKFDDTRLSY